MLHLLRHGTTPLERCHNAIDHVDATERYRLLERTEADLTSFGGDEHFGDVLETEHAHVESVLYSRVDE